MEKSLVPAAKTEYLICVVEEILGKKHKEAVKLERL